MSVPGIVQSRLDGEQVAARVALGGEDALYVTPTRTLIYRADGLLSDESVEEYAHGAERIEISEGRRKSAVELDYGIDGTEKFKLPSNRLYEALHPVLAGVLNAADVTGPEETVKQTYQFSELTLVVTSERVVKHVGAAVWDQDYEEYHFDDVTALDVEEGSVSSQIIIESGGRPQRIKTPSDQTREVRERIERALLDYHGAGSYEEFARQHADPDGDADDESESTSEATEDNENADPLAGGGVDPIDANPPELDDDGAIIEDDASVTTGDRPGDTETASASTETNTAESDEVATSTSSQSADTGESPPVATDDRPETVATDAEPISETGGTADATDAATPADETTSTDEAGQATVTSDSGFADSGFEPANSELEDDREAQLETLIEEMQRQNELLSELLVEQQRTLEELVEELNRGR